jgi:hypothetical protein
MVHDSRFLVGPFEPIKSRVGQVLATVYDRGSGTSLGSSEVFSKVRSEMKAPHYSENWRDFQNQGVARLAGRSGSFELPLWLTTHSGVSLKSNDDPRDDRQNRGWGYLQLKGDDDGTGRHDHLIGTMLLGWAAERARLSKIGMADAHAGACPVRNEFKAIFNVIRPANWLYTSVRVTAPYAEEYLSPSQNHSKTDATVNRRGQALGAKLAHASNALSARDFNAAVYSAICDESEIEPVLHGPVSAEGLELIK